MKYSSSLTKQGTSTQFLLVPLMQPLTPIPEPTMPGGQLQATVLEISRQEACGWQILLLAQVVTAPAGESLEPGCVLDVRVQVRPSPDQPKGHSPQ